MTLPLQQPASVVQVGPALQVRGGVSAVERLIVNVLAARYGIRHVATMEDGSAPRKALVFARALRNLQPILRTHATLVVHIHFASWGSTLRKMIVARRAARAGHRVVLHAHGGGFAEFLGRMPGPFRRRILRFLRDADHLVVLSSQWRDFYVNECGVPPARVTVLPNPVRVPDVVPDRAGRAVVRLLYIGRMSESKGTFDLLRALALVPDAVRGRLRVTLAGDGAVAQVRALAAQTAAQITVMEWVDEPTRDRLLAEADVFVLPSYQEGIPMSLLEAMAWGLPSIVTPVGGIPDVFTDGEHGRLVQPGDVAGLAECIGALAQDEPSRLDMGRRSRERARDFDLRHYGERLSAIYDYVLMDGPHARN